MMKDATHNKIIHFLKKRDAYLSGEELSRALAVSRAAIWKHVQELRTQGYDIVAVPHLGYKLVSCPDKLYAHEIQHNLHTKVFGKKIIHYESIASTMDAAFDLGMQGASEGTAVCAESQTKGRGRLQRGWVSPKGKGVYLSIILRPQIVPAEVSRLTLLCAVAVCEAVKSMTALPAAIKWPNDVMIRNKKVAGILTEMSAEADCVRFLVVGIGVNVNVKREHLLSSATSLSSELKKPASRVELTQELLRKIEHWYTRMHEHGFSCVAERWRELSLTLHRHVRIVDAGGKTEGEAVDIDADGGLLIRTATGMMVKKMAGDVTLAR